MFKAYLPLTLMGLHAEGACALASPTAAAGGFSKAAALAHAPVSTCWEAALYASPGPPGISVNFYFLEGIGPFCWSTVTPVLNYSISKLGWIPCSCAWSPLSATPAGL